MYKLTRVYKLTHDQLTHNQLTNYQLTHNQPTALVGTALVGSALVGSALAGSEQNLKRTRAVENTFCKIVENKLYRNEQILYRSIENTFYVEK